MAKFNAKKVTGPTETNYMGENAYALSDKEKLTSMVMTTFLADAYYKSETQIVKDIKSLVEQVDNDYVAKLALYARTKGNMRSVTHLLSALVCKDSATKPWLKSFYEKVAIRPDDISETLACYAALNGIDISKSTFKKIPNSMKKGFGKVLSNLSPYQIDKYKMNGRALSLVDLVNLLHPIPTQKNEAAYKLLMHGESLAGTYDSKILEKEMSAAGQNAKDEDEKLEMKHDAIKGVLEKGMPIMNLLRNLRNILIYAPDMVDEAIRQLTNRDKILNGKLLPFRFMSAYDVVNHLRYDEFNRNEGGDGEATEIEFESDSPSLSPNEVKELKEKVLKGLEDAITIACENIPQLQGNCAILIDHSGSVRGDWGGSSRVSPWSNVRTAHIGNLFGSMLAYRQNDVYIGMFGDKLISPKIDRSIGMLEFNEKSYAQGEDCGGATENGLYDFLKKVIKEKKHIDNFIVFSDMEIGDGGEGRWDYSSRVQERFQDLFKEFRKINPNCLTTCVNIHAQSGTSVFNPNLNLLNVSGWSNSIFDTINLYSQGKVKSLVEEIEQIQL